MGEIIRLVASDGHTFDTYRALPQGTARAGLVVIQEIFGVNSHIRSVADGFAADGYEVLAPALFDRVRPGIELGYSAADIAEGRDIRARIPEACALADIAASIEALGAVHSTAGAPKVGAIGYCWGGSLVWAAACRLPGLAVGVCYYGGQILDSADEKPDCPVLLHFGETDASIPIERVRSLHEAQPDLPLHIYPAGHGFNCDQRGAYDADCAALARQRSLAFLAHRL